MSAGVNRRGHSQQSVSNKESSSHYLSHPQSDHGSLTPVWETLDDFFETDFSGLHVNSSCTATERTRQLTSGMVNRLSQKADLTVFHMDVGHCPKIRNTEFKAAIGLVIGPEWNFSGSCHGTAVVPEGFFISAAVHVGQCSRKNNGN